MPAENRKLKVLLIGSGGREHAMAWKMAQSDRVDALFCAPGNPGIAQIATVVDISSSNIPDLCHFVKDQEIDLTIVGPEAPLVAGIVDEFSRQGLRIFGPSAAAARLEGSKVFAKQFMARHRIPTAGCRIFEEVQEARDYLQTCAIPVVVKADGLAAGKGAIVASSRQEANEALDDLMVRQIYGEAGNRVVIEEFMAGEEVSVFCVADGRDFFILPPAQDHKAVYDGDQGPNTGGMGAYSPAPVLTKPLLRKVEDEIVQPVLAGMAAEGTAYRGVLYVGLMITPSGPKVVEFNCRLGDPEAQAILPLLDSDFVEAAWLAAEGRLSDYRVTFKDGWALTVVMASGGYPGDYSTGKEISGIDLAEKDALVFHAGTKKAGDRKYVTAGGRVLGVTGLGKDFETARDLAYRAVAQINFENAHYRTDIGAKALLHL